MSDDGVVDLGARRVAAASAQADEIAQVICREFSRLEARIMEDARRRFGPGAEAQIMEGVNRARRAVSFLCPAAHLRVEAAAWEAKARELRAKADEIEKGGG